MYLNIRLWNIEETHSDQNEPIFQFLEEKLDVEINRKLETTSLHGSPQLRIKSETETQSTGASSKMKW